MGIDILGVDILGIDILGIDIVALPHGEAVRYGTVNTLFTLLFPESQESTTTKV